MLLVLLNSVGSYDDDVLKSQGFDLGTQTDKHYVGAIELSKGYYEKKVNM